MRISNTQEGWMRGLQPNLGKKGRNTIGFLYIGVNFIVTVSVFSNITHALGVHL